MAEPKERFVHPNCFHLYTDGSFRPPDAAACAYVIFSEKTQHVVAMDRYAYRGMTINQMELLAISHALDHPNMDYVHVHTDSAYAINCLTIWYRNWQKNNWINPLGEPIKNREVIESILAKMAKKKYVHFVKVKAHTGNPFNSLADYLAVTLTGRMMTDPSIHTDRYPV